MNIFVAFVNYNHYTCEGRVPGNIPLFYRVILKSKTSSKQLARNMPITTYGTWWRKHRSM